MTVPKLIAGIVSEAALTKLAEMRATCCCIDIRSDYDFVWGVRFAYSDEHLWSTDDYNHETLDDAINAAYERWLELKETTPC